MKKIKYIALLLGTTLALNGTAQTAKSAYFLDGAFYNYQMNPAMKAERGFFSVGIGNLALGTNGNVGISNFLYPMGNNKLTTFMSSRVSQDEFLNKLPDASRIGFNLDETLLATGFRMFRGFTTISISLHSDMGLSLPKGFFEFAKKGFQNQRYSFSGINVNTQNYAAVTIGHSREIIEGLRVGVNAKYLLGLAYADVTVDKLNLELSESHWLAESHAQAKIGIGTDARLTTDGEGMINGMELGPIAPSATGFAFDLGIVYDMNAIVPGLTLSASVTDIGKLNWRHTQLLNSYEGKVEFNGLEEIDPEDFNKTWEAEMEKLGEDASEMIKFELGDVESSSTALNTTMYLGAEYNMPFYNPLSVGILYGQRFTSSAFNKWHEVRGYANIAPHKWIEASVNFGTTSYGTSLGWMLNFHPAGLTFFVGSDYMVTKVTPMFIPVNDLNTHITLGMNLALGKRK